MRSLRGNRIAPNCADRNSATEPRCERRVDIGEEMSGLNNVGAKLPQRMA
jgi:hypothetical protein